MGARAVLGAVVSAAALASFAPPARAVGTRHFVLESGSDFKSGDLKGAAVDSNGTLRPGWDLGSSEVPDADNIWDAYYDDGSVYLGTGNEAKLLQLKDGKVSTVAKAEAIAVTSIVRAFGRLLVGTMPGGKILELKGDKFVSFSELDGVAHIWGLAFDEKTKVLYAVTGPHGKLFRVTADGTSQVYFDSPQDHLVSVLARGGEVYVGSSGDARLYKVTGPGRATVLYDFGVTEVRAVAQASDGSLFAIANELKAGPRSDSIKATEASAPHTGEPSGGKGQIYRFHPDGRPELLYSDDDEHFVSLALDEAGHPVVGTGSEGRVLTVDSDHRSSVIADVDERQASKILLLKGGGWVMASDPVVAHPITGIGSKNATFESKPFDAGFRARFGRIEWDGRGKFEVFSRSGNTEKPDETWSDWTQSLARGSVVSSAPARYLQLRVRLLNSEARLTRLDVPFVTDNLRPVVTQVQAKSTATTDGSSGVQKSGAPIDGKTSSEIKLSWEVSNPDEDPLRYFVEYRRLSDQRWLDALEPGQVLTSDSLEWDTSDMPEGRYQVRVTASDELANPPSRVQKHQLESDTILVDNTPPRLTGVRIAGGKLVGVVKDGIGPIRRLELRVSGQQAWVPFEPADGIFDEVEESFALDLAGIPLPEAALVTVRGFDTAGNSDVSHVKLSPARP